MVVLDFRWQSWQGGKARYLHLYGRRGDCEAIEFRLVYIECLSSVWPILYILCLTIWPAVGI